MKCKVMLTNSNTTLELYAPFARNTIEVGSKRPLMLKHQKRDSNTDLIIATTHWFLFY